MRQFHTEGEPFARGQQQGKVVADLALPWMERVISGLCEAFGETGTAGLVQRTRADVDRWVAQWEAAWPAAVEECHGLAAGLGLPTDQYLILCCYHRLSGALPQCTLLGTRTDAGDPVIGKSDDIEAQDLGMNVLEVTRPADGFAHLHFHFAGTPFTVAGMNETGLAMGMTGIPGPVLERDGLFSLLALHSILPACADVSEAIEHIRHVPVNAYGFSLMLADRAGQLALVEKNGVDVSVVRHEACDKPLAHTNHILDAELAEKCPSQAEPLLSNSRSRFDNATRLLADGLRVDQVLLDRSDDGGICQQGAAGLHTDFAVHMQPASAKLELWPGYPAQVASRRIDVDFDALESAVRATETV